MDEHVLYRTRAALEAANRRFDQSREKGRCATVNRTDLAELLAELAVLRTQKPPVSPIRIGPNPVLLWQHGMTSLTVAALMGATTVYAAFCLATGHVIPH